MNAYLIRSDARSVPLRDESVDCVLTSPPYWGLRDYGVPPSVWGGAPGCAHGWESTPAREGYNAKTKWQHAATRQDDPEAWGKVTNGAFCRCGAWRGVLGLEPTVPMYVEHQVTIAAEMRRVLRPQGTLWLNLGDCYAGSWSGNSMRPEGGSQRPGGPGFQDLRSGYPARNGVVPEGLKPKDLVGIPWRVALALQADGWWLRSDIVWHKPNPMPESILDRPTRAHEYVFLLAKSQRYYYDADAIREPHQYGNGGDHHRNVDGRGQYQAPGQPEHRGLHATRGWDTREEIPGRRQAPEPGEEGAFHPLGRNKRSVWTIATQPYSGAHFATFPEELARTCIRAGCPVGGRVLDPFGGSGTVGRVAIQEGRDAVLCDLAYQDLAARRITNVQRPLMVNA
jgi:DNA modification methylase